MEVIFSSLGKLKTFVAYKNASLFVAREIVLPRSSSTTALAWSRIRTFDYHLAMSHLREELIGVGDSEVR